MALGDGSRFGYDPNGNMISRTIGVTYTLDYDAENRLQTVTNTDTGEETWFIYDADACPELVEGAGG
jgi:hypothetical protein